MCIAKKKKKSGEGTGEQQDAGQGGNNNRPLTLTAVTRTAASPSREPNPVSGLGPEVSSGPRSTGCVSFKFCSCCLFFLPPTGLLVIFKCQLIR